ncbi:MAG TPA: copper resistance CopC family protein [Micromonosporaceae bacterium]
MHVTRLAAGLVVAVAVVVLTPAQALAHSALLGTDPADGAVVTAPIGEVVLTFNELVHQQFSTIVVTGPGGASYGDGPLQVIDTKVHQPVWPLHSGTYRVAWRVISADGHPVSGEFGFQVTLPPSLEPTADPPSPAPAGPARGSGVGVWVWWLAGGVLAAVVGVALLVVGRRRVTDGE